MKANELRVNNIVHANCITKLNVGETHTDQDVVIVAAIDYQEIETVGAWSIHGGLACILESESEWVSPIPLTEDWLLNFGFKRDSCQDGPTFYNGKVEIGTSFDYREYWIPFGHWNKGSIHIAHVHQLQNIYFALTGEELILF